MELASSWVLNVVQATTAVSLLELQSPATGVLVSDPVEDLTLLRIVGDFRVTLAAPGTARGTRAVTVQDTTWTPNAAFSNDADKRMLWSCVYDTVSVIPAGASAYVWSPPGLFQVDATVDTVVPLGDRSMVHIDISPDVKVRAGQALNLVWYEDTASTFSTASLNMRVLFQRSGRR